ncbi:hypothetical protein FGRMN_8655 [Fusarium graminum]|nr:hypothetical protein FGRMN_8655 [Fusarium graminum]
MSKAEVQAWAQTSQPTAADKITIGAAVVRIDGRGAKRILVLKRAAHEVYYPGVFEVPGGKVDDTDLSIREAITREVKEETGLTIANILNSLAPFTYVTEKKIKKRTVLQTIRKTALQLSYLVQVEEGGDDFTVNPNEHSEGLWVNSEGLDSVEMTNEMRKLVSEAFQASQ